MKKVLFATTALMLTTGIALAEVKIGGSGRFGLLYQETPDILGDNQTNINYRLRFNIDATKETDSGVTFGGRIRMQYTNGSGNLVGANTPGSSFSFPTGSTGARLNAAQINVKYSGMQLQVGNVDTAYDSAALMYNSEMGFDEASFGDPQGVYFSYASSPYASVYNNRMGVFFSYGIENFNVRLSWVNADQTGTFLAGVDRVIADPLSTPAQIAAAEAIARVGGYKDEYGISADYVFGQFTVAAAYVNNGAGIDNNDQFFIAGEYAFNDLGAVGLAYIDNGDPTPDTDGDLGQQVTLYGNYRFGDIIGRAYIANNDADVFTDSTVGGLGVDYDLGGATLAGSVQSDYFGNIRADAGVRFSF